MSETRNISDRELADALVRTKRYEAEGRRLDGSLDIKPRQTYVELAGENAYLRRQAEERLREIERLRREFANAQKRAALECAARVKAEREAERKLAQLQEKIVRLAADKAKQREISRRANASARKCYNTEARPVLLVKDGVNLPFESLSAAARFLGVTQPAVACALARGGKTQGYTVCLAKEVQENEKG